MKKGIGNIAKYLLGVASAIFLLLTGLASISQWNWSSWFTTIVLVATGIYLLGESGMKNIGSFKSLGKNFNGLIHLGSFAFGILLIYMGIISIPQLGAFAVVQVEQFSGWIMFIGGALALSEPFIK